MPQSMPQSERLQIAFVVMQLISKLQFTHRMTRTALIADRFARQDSRRDRLLRRLATLTFLTPRTMDFGPTSAGPSLMNSPSQV
jgi:hypothetical protein